MDKTELKLLILLFSKEGDAQQAIDLVKNVYKEKDVGLQAAVVIIKDQHSGVHYKDIGITPAKNALGGMVMGAVLGVMTGGVGIALGAAGALVGGLTQAMPCGGGTSQTAVNDQSGAKSQVAELATAGTVLVTMLFLAPLISLMPEATLGALVLVAAAGLIKITEFQKIRKIRNVELVWALAAFFGVMILGTLQGILLAVILSIIALLYLAGHPPVYIVGRKPGTDVFRPIADHPQDETFPGLLMLRTEGMLYFASAPRAIDQIALLLREHQPKVVVLDCRAVPNFEYTALTEFSDYESKLKDSGVELWLAALNREAFETVEKSNLGKALGHKRLFFNLEQAVEEFQGINLDGKSLHNSVDDKE